MSVLLISLLCNLVIADESETNNSAAMSRQEMQNRIKLLQKKLNDKNQPLEEKNAETLKELKSPVIKHLSISQNIKNLVNKSADQKEVDLRTEGMKLRSSLQKQFSYLSQREIDILVEKFEDNRLEGVTASATEDMARVEKINYKPTEGQGYKPTTSTQISKITDFLKNKKKQPRKTQTKNIQVDARLVEEGNTTMTELIIKNGDTLSDIAKRNYGNSSMYMPIFMANQDKLETPHFVPEGIKLKIPTIKNVQNWKDHPDTFKKKIARKKKIKKLKKKSIAKKKRVRKKPKVKKENKVKKIKPLSDRRIEEVARQILEGKL